MILHLLRLQRAAVTRTSIFSRIFKMRLKQALESVHTIFSALTVQELHRLKILSKPCQNTQNMLPPVIDLEFYAQHGSDPPEKEETRYNLQKMIDAAYDYYGLMPVIYVTDITYELYIKGYFDDNDIWIRSIFTKAELPDERKWTFWQYCNRGRLDGYDGAEQYIDLNVFNGTKEEFENYKGFDCVF